jgi:hypothetical protein
LQETQAGGILVNSFHEQYLFIMVDLAESHLDDFLFRSLHVPADKGRLDRKLAMSPVDEHKQLHTPWTAVVEQRVECGPDRSSRVQDVVDEDNVTACNIESNRPGADYRPGIMRRQVVAIEAYVKNTRVNRLFFDAADQRAQAFRKRNPTAFDADKTQIAAAVALLYDFVREPNERALDLRG